MTFIEEAIRRAGLGAVLEAKRAGDLDEVRRTLDTWAGADLMALGALADLLRAEEVGDVVRIHGEGERAGGVLWVQVPAEASDLALLRAVAVARVAASRGARIGVDWARSGLELAQVALGFGATDLRGPITRKSGLPILEGESIKVKGEGKVALASIKARELADLVRYAGRAPVFAADEAREPARAAAQEVSGA